MTTVRKRIGRPRKPGPRKTSISFAISEPAFQAFAAKLDLEGREISSFLREYIYRYIGPIEEPVWTPPIDSPTVIEHEPPPKVENAPEALKTDIAQPGTRDYI